MIPQLSLIIPTFNGRRVLPAVLRGLETQRRAVPFEVVVVDDGSSDGTPAWLETWEGVLDLQILTQERQGPAAARNAGVAVARGATIVFLGDDTVPTPGWLAAHCEARNRYRRYQPLAVVGHTTLHPRIRQTRFLSWLYTEGGQFGYGQIEDPEDLSFKLFYSSNVSLPRQSLLEEPFDSAFPDAAWEDTELGYRLTKKGMRIVFEKNAHLLHDHPATLKSFCRRQERAGRSAVVFYRRHRELGSLLSLGPEGAPPRPRLAGHLGRALCARVLERLPVELPRWWSEVPYYHYVRGLEQGWSDGSGTPPIR